jgi:hypothetical protein
VIGGLGERGGLEASEIGLVDDYEMLNDLLGECGAIVVRTSRLLASSLGSPKFAYSRNAILSVPHPDTYEAAVSTRLENAANGVMICVAVVVVCIALRRELRETRGTGAAANATRRTQNTQFLPEMSEIARVGRTLGDPAAPVRIVEFLDLQCPACRRYNEKVLSEVRSKLGSKASITYVHFPLSIHRMAPIAARAAECAAESGQFFPFVERAYAVQDSFGIKPWTEYAHEAGVRDTNRLSRCVRSVDPLPRIEAGTALATKLELSATPTIVINGWKYGMPPSAEELSKAAFAILAGKDPYPRDTGVVSMK